MENIDILQRNYETFLGKINQLFQGAIIDPAAPIDLQKTIGTSLIKLKKQQNINSIAEMLEKELSVNILYCIKSSDNRTHQALLYSMPYDDESYVINITSVMFGVVEKINLVFYRSLDTMFSKLNEKYQSLDENQWEIVKMQRPEVFFGKFAFANNLQK